MKPLTYRGIGDTETIPTSSTPHLMFSHLPAALVPVPLLDPQLMPHHHCLCHMSSTIVLSHSALINIPPVKIPLPPSFKQSQCQPHLVFTEGVCLCMRLMFPFSYCSSFMASYYTTFSLSFSLITSCCGLVFPLCGFLFPSVSWCLVLCSLLHVLPLPSSLWPFIPCTNSPSCALHSSYDYFVFQCPQTVSHVFKCMLLNLF